MNNTVNKLVNQADKVNAMANESGVTYTDIGALDSELDKNSGVGYYDPPYS